MKTIRRLAITVEKRERLSIKRSDSAFPVWCSQCAGQLITADEAVAVAGLSSRAIHRRAEAGDVHFVESRDGLLLVCLSSLLAGTD